MTAMGICKIDERKRITLPKPVLKFLNLNSGDLVSIENDDNFLCLHKAYICIKRNKNKCGGVDETKEGSKTD